MSILASVMQTNSTKQILIGKYKGDVYWETTDQLAVEEPLEIRLEYGAAGRRKSQSLSITMRTPGNDEDLALGFLFTEGIIKQSREIFSVKSWGENLVMVSLQADMDIDLKKLERHFYTSSSCGVCGKSSMDAVRIATPYACAPSEWSAPVEVIYGLADTLRQAQATFDATGGLHAAALFDRDGKLLLLREDVGRHNALDKLIGHYFRAQQLPLREKILMLSGRASFELIQKSAMAGIPMVCAVGAPSSLAVETAQQFGLTLVGFLREGRFNVYSGMQSIQ